MRDVISVPAPGLDLRRVYGHHQSRRSGPVDPLTGGRNLGPLAEQIRQTLRNMTHMLVSAGSGLDRIVKMTVVLADAGDYDEMNRVWLEFFPVDPPARTACALRLSNGNGVEIECIALGGKSPS